jgi:c-di-GMP-binding flagellar brake protein YcgR
VAEDLIAGLVLNLSTNGMLVESQVPLQVGRELEFSFRLPDEAALITGSGRIVREATPTRFGVEFLVLDGEDRERIRRACAGADDR